MNEMQQNLLNILIWFHKFCNDHKLTYYMSYGTMLGAVRHKGFIPWDDDLDVSMPRNDYERFLELTFNKKGRYRVESYKNGNEDFPYSFTKIYDSQTLLIETFKHKVIRGIFLDVFPLDGAGNSVEEANKINKKGKIIELQKIIALYYLPKRRQLVKKILYRFYLCVPPYKNKLIKLSKKINNYYSKADYKNSSYIQSACEDSRTHFVMPKSYFGTPKLYEFENMNFYGPELFELYLTSLYGNWEILPPLNQRISTHSFSFCDFNKSYLTFKR